MIPVESKDGSRGYVSKRDAHGLYRQSAKRLQWLYYGSNSPKHKRYAERMQECAGRHYCRVRFCTVCQWRRMRLLWNKLNQSVVPALQADYPTAQFLVMTLYAQGCRPKYLREMLDLMCKAWQRLIQKKIFGHHKDYFKLVVGYMRTIHVSREGDGNVRPSFRCVLMVDLTHHIQQTQWEELLTTCDTLWEEALRVPSDVLVELEETDWSVFNHPVKIFNFPHFGKVKFLSQEEKGEVRKYILALTDQMWKTRAFVTGGVIKEYVRKYDLYEPSHSLKAWGGFRGDQEEVDAYTSSREMDIEVLDKIQERLMSERGLSRDEALAVITGIV